MSDITHIKIPSELFVLPLKGIYEMSVVALVYNFGDKGLKVSNGKLAQALKTSSRTIERVIAKLRKKGFVEDAGVGNNDRCLKLSTDTMSVVTTDVKGGNYRHQVGVTTDVRSGKLPTSGVVTTDVTADHNKVTKKNITKGGISCGEFMAFWNQHRNLPKIRAFTDHRKLSLAVRGKNPEFADNWELIIDKLSRSQFHTGTNDRKWRATVDWLLKSDNYIKILELDGVEPQRGDTDWLPTEEEAEELMKEVEA